jgi:hypothetical protein
VACSATPAALAPSGSTPTHTSARAETCAQSCGAAYGCACDSGRSLACIGGHGRFRDFRQAIGAERFHGFPDGTLRDWIHTHACGIQHIHRVGTHVAGQDGLRALLNDELGGLDSGPARCAHRRVGDRAEFHALCVHEQIERASPENRADCRVHIIARGADDNFHGENLLWFTNLSMM